MGKLALGYATKAAVLEPHLDILVLILLLQIISSRA